MPKCDFWTAASGLFFNKKRTCSKILARLNVLYFERFPASKCSYCVPIIHDCSLLVNNTTRIF